MAPSVARWLGHGILAAIDRSHGYSAILGADFLNLWRHARGQAAAKTSTLPPSYIDADMDLLDSMLSWITLVICCPTITPPRASPPAR